MLGRVLFGAAIAAGVGYAYPLVNEHAATPCQALERRLITMAAPASLLRHPGPTFEWAVARAYVEPLSDGRLAAAAIKRRYPTLPPQVGCAVDYWGTLLDPRAQQAVTDAMR
jgi:hypothetical protein